MQSDRDRILEATDLVALVGEHVALKPKGREHVGLCPFHDDRTPSLAVVTHKGNHFYKCFACNAAGNAIDFMMQYHRMEFPEALRVLAQRCGITLRARSTDERTEVDPRSDRALLRRAAFAAQRFFRASLADEKLGASARAVIESRGISPAMAERFGLGAAPEGWDHFVRHLERLERHEAGAADAGRGISRGGARPGARSGGSPRAAGASGGDDGVVPRATFEAAGLVRAGQRGPIDGFRNRLTFPIWDELGNPVAFGARKIDPDDEPKYLNSPESAIFHKGRSLYGLHLARRAIIERGHAIVCEGYTDCIACHAAGFEHAVATLGTALTRDHARLLQRLGDRVILLFDGDEAGQRAADRAVEVFFAEPIDVLICTLPDGLDPDELLRAEDGAARFRAALERSVDAVTYQVRRFQSSWRGASGMAGRQQRLEAMLARLSELGLAKLGGIRKQMVFSALADLTGFRTEDLDRFMPAPRRGAEVRGAAAGGDSLSAGGGPSNDPRLRARIEAERNLLALLVFEPSLGTESLPTDDGALPITEAFAPQTFAEESHQRIAALLWHAIESGNRPSLQSLLAEVVEGVDKSLVSDLFSIGSRRLDPQGRAERTAREAVRDAALDLERVVRLRALDGERSPAEATESPAALLEQLERLRRRGPDPAAIARNRPRSGHAPSSGLESSPIFSPAATSAPSDPSN
ncbi:MAG: toprim domain-containing protein [Phycisphaerae bacterium]|nr:toprim domain-containing protein [Phycisphaerae bacterium]